METEEILQELENVEAEMLLVQEQIKQLVDRQDQLYERQSELKSLLEAFEASRGSPIQYGGSSSTAVENWSGTFEWDSRADDVRLNVFGIPAYRANQREIVNAVLSGKDVLVIMAAGGGKSLCYQLPAILREGIALVVSPLLSLIQDQVMCLAALGIPAHMLTSTTSKEDEKFIYKALEKGEGKLKMLYVTPEKISKSKRFMSKLEKCHHAGRLSLISIDEAHCCSQWGHDFRPDYKNLGILKTQFPDVPMVALTATATQKVQNDLMEMLRIRKCIKFVSTINRPNLFYMVREKSSVGKVVIDEIAEYIQESYPNSESGIVYCFSRKECEQELTTGRMIGCARESGGLYFFEDGSNMIRPSQNTCYGSVSITTNKEIMLWHFRLGHPNFHYLRHLLPDLFNNKDPSLFQCEICELANHHRSTFSIQPYQPSKPFLLLHTDVWGPNKIPTLSGKRWFVTFIDDHTRVCWVYLLKEKSEVESVFQNFYTMVLTQFQEKIRIIRSDNGKEYFNKILGKFFLEKGIVHQSSCNNTPQQNGVAERKNKHLLEVARALLFSKNVPKYLWGEAILTATYLINRMPSRVLNFQTPLNFFKTFYPNSRLISGIALKIFGCIAFVHNHEHGQGKLDPRARKCIFVGYTPTQKGYKCFDPVSKKMFITMDVTFFEDKPFFEKHLRGIRHEEELVEDDVFHIIDQRIDQKIADRGIDWMEEYPNSITTDFPQKESFHNNYPEKSDVSIQSTSQKEINIEKNKNLDSLPLVPITESNSPSERDRNVTEKTLQTYIRRNYQAKDKVLPSLHNQESEPRTEPAVSESSGKNSSNPEFDDLDLPIASRKGVRSCTKYPMSNYISYDKLSPKFFAFTSQLSSVEIPKNVQEALRVPEWRKAIEEEMQALEKNQTWDVTDLPNGKKTVGCKWVFAIKYNSNGTLERYKARLVAKGFTQTYGIDYLETFAPVAKLNTVRVLLSMAVNLDWPLQQLDVKNAFLNGDLEEEVYMDSPPGFERKFQSRVCKLKKSLYGLKQSPRAWFEKFTRSVKDQGYAQAQSDHTMFFKHSKDGKIAVLIVYVDDIILTGDDLIEIERLKKSLASSFEIKDLGTLRYFLGMEVARSKKGLVVSQRKYVLDLLKETGMSGCRPADTPMDPNHKLAEIKDETPVDIVRYQKLVGKLIYLAHTRPDIAFSVSVVSQFMHSPYEGHLEAVYRILRYLKGNPGKGLCFKKGVRRTIEAYTDADWAGSATDRRSTSGYCTFVWGNLVTWRSKKQSVVSRSSAEAEYRAMAHGVCEILWLKRVLDELRRPIEVPMRLYCDNKSAISIAHNPVQHDRTKHIEIDRHFIKEKLEEGIICMPFVPSAQQIADILTKGLFRPNFELLTSKLGMLNIYAPT